MDFELFVSSFNKHLLSNFYMLSPELCTNLKPMQPLSLEDSQSIAVMRYGEHSLNDIQGRALVTYGEDGSGLEV